MAEIRDRSGKLIAYDDYADLRGNQQHKNIEKAHGPFAMVGDRPIRKCPLCLLCDKSFDPDVPNKVTLGCDGECACHDGLEDDERYGSR